MLQTVLTSSLSLSLSLSLYTLHLSEGLEGKACEPSNRMAPFLPPLIKQAHTSPKIFHVRLFSAALSSSPSQIRNPQAESRFIEI
jgi:hypothetical protein